MRTLKYINFMLMYFSITFKAKNELELLETK